MDNYTKQSIKYEIQTVVKKEMSAVLNRYKLDKDAIDEITSAISAMSILILNSHL